MGVVVGNVSRPLWAGKGSFTIFGCKWSPARMCLTAGASDCSGHGLSHKEHAVMTLFAKTRIALISAAAGLGALTAAAIAQPSISLDVDTARVVKLGGEPATVVLSNPMFADATLQRDRLIILGKTTGRTQVIVLDLDGNQLANFMVSVQRTENQVVSMYKAGTRSTYHCEPFCDAVLNVGDDGVFFTGMEEQIRKKSVISSGAAQQGGGGAQ
jgi:hypothetical protein